MKSCKLAMGLAISAALFATLTLLPLGCAVWPVFGTGRSTGRGLLTGVCGGGAGCVALPHGFVEA